MRKHKLYNLNNISHKICEIEIKAPSFHPSSSLFHCSRVSSAGQV